MMSYSIVIDRYTSILNGHFKKQMEGITAKDFRTFNGSLTLEQELVKLNNQNAFEAE